MRWSWGVDPGARSGAVAALDEHGLVAWSTWLWLAGKGGRYRLTTGPRCRESADLGALLLEAFSGMDTGERVVVEGLFVPHAARANPQSFIPLAESAGRLLGAIEQLGGVVHRLRANDWRAQVLGLPRRTPADEAEAAAVAYAGREVVGAAEALEMVSAVERGALAEAICMAVAAREVSDAG